MLTSDTGDLTSSFFYDMIADLLCIGLTKKYVCSFKVFQWLHIKATVTITMLRCCLHAYSIIKESLACFYHCFQAQAE